MGYRSEVAIIIEPAHITAQELFDRFGEAYPTEYNLIRPLYEVTITKKRFTFHAGDVKWYVGDPEYVEVNALTKLVEWAQGHSADWGGNPEPINANDGAFIRLGENQGDIETDYWGEDPYSLAIVQTVVDIQSED